MDEKIIELAKKLVEKRIASNYEEALILAEKFTKIDMKYDYDNSFIEEKKAEENIGENNIEKNRNESDGENERNSETYIIGETTSKETLNNAISSFKTIQIYENVKLVKKTHGFENTRHLLKQTSISNSINNTLGEKKLIEENKKNNEEKKSDVNEQKNNKVEDPKKRLYNSVDINNFFNVNNLKGKEIPKGK